MKDLLHYDPETGVGYFDTPELASAAYTAAQEKYHTHRPEGKNNGH